MSYSELLSQVPMFAHLEDEDLERLSLLLSARHHARGEVIFLEGDVGTSLYIVYTGEVAIRLTTPDGKEMTLTLLVRGDSFGELALLDGEPRSTDAVAREDTTLLSLGQADFHRFLEERPQAVRELLAELAQMVRRLTRRVHDTNFRDARARLARGLIQLAETQGQPVPRGILIPSRLTQTDLANLAGLTRESANKWLRYYIRQEVLAHEDGHILLLDLERLRRDTDE